MSWRYQRTSLISRFRGERLLADSRPACGNSLSSTHSLADIGIFVRDFLPGGKPSRTKTYLSAGPARRSLISLAEVRLRIHRWMVWERIDPPPGRRSVWPEATLEWLVRCRFPLKWYLSPPRPDLSGERCHSPALSGTKPFLFLASWSAWKRTVRPIFKI